MSLQVNPGHPSITLSGTELLQIAALVKRGIDRMEQLDSITGTIETVRELNRIANATKARMSAEGQRTRTFEANTAPSVPDVDRPQEITVAEAAKILGITPRHVRRIADQIGTLRSQPITFDRELVEAYKLHRDEKRRA